jgi:integrating conjugative element protein (TIGR03749 family)
MKWLTIKLSLCVVTLGLCQLSLAEVDKRIWDNMPMTIILPVNKEVRVTFPTDVNIQIPKELTTHLVSLAPNQKIIYWTAKAPFDSSRILATSTDNETVYLIDLVANEYTTVNDPVVIEDADRIAEESSSEEYELNADSLSESESVLTDPPEILLTRFASQTLYAPRRLVPQSSDIADLHVDSIAKDFPLIQSQSGEQFHFHIVGAWAGYGRYITAILVINQSNHPVLLNPGLVRGNFTHITAQHADLGSAGTLKDRTTLFLISDVPFVSALMEEGYGY